MDNIGLPYAETSELHILSTVINFPEIAPNIFQQIKPDHFYKNCNKLIYETMLQMFEEKVYIDVITLSETLQNNNELIKAGDRYYINDLALYSSTSTTINFHINQIKSKYSNRELLKIGSSIQDKVNNNQDLDKIIFDTETEISKLINDKSTSKIIQLKDIILKSFNYLEEQFNSENGFTGISTGFYDLDSILCGLNKSDLIILAARPSMGKTALALNIGLNVSSMFNTPVGFFSLEMSELQLATRILCTESDLNSAKLKSKTMNMDDWERVSKKLAYLQNPKFFIVDNPSASILDIKANALRLKYENPDLGLIIIDYLQLINSSGKTQNREQEIAKISRNLKCLARELDIPIIVLSQLSRAVEQRQNKRPMLSDLRESGSIEQDADVVMFIYRDEYYNPEIIENKNQAEIIIAKQRNGATGKINLLFNHVTTKFLNKV